MFSKTTGKKLDWLENKSFNTENAFTIAKFHASRSDVQDKERAEADNTVTSCVQPQEEEYSSRKRQRETLRPHDERKQKSHKKHKSHHRHSTKYSSDSEGSSRRHSKKKKKHRKHKHGSRSRRQSSSSSDESYKMSSTQLKGDAHENR